MSEKSGAAGVAALLACTLLMLAAGAARAARPMVTDDARVVDAKACQLETWLRHNRGSTERWALPACNPTGNLELTYGGALTTEFGQTTTTDVQLQGKTLFRRLETNGWGMGLVVGHLRRPAEPRHDVLGNLYTYVPASFSLYDDRLVMHINVGAARPENSGRHRLTGGIGAEVQLTSALYFIPEVFSQSAGRPQYQAGIRYWVVPDRVQIDATYGDRMGHAGSERRWFSLGLRLLMPPFLP